MSTTNEEPRRGRGRPRAYDEGAALDAALKVFWTRGYEGTSLDDLTAAMAMSRPSVYAAFGNKQAVYRAAVDHYVATVGANYLLPLRREAALRDGLLGFYDAVIDVVTGRLGPRGCIVACTLPAEAESSAEAREHLAAVLAVLDDGIATRLRAARAAGELAKDADPALLAQVVTSGMIAISIRARAGAARGPLRKLARSVVDLVAPKPLA